MSAEAITTVLVPATATAPAEPYDLTDLATARSELGIVDPTKVQDDAFISRAITQASRAIANYCNRVFQAEVVQDQFFVHQYAYPWQIPSDLRALQLSRWPFAYAQVETFTGNTNASRVVTGASSTAGLSVGMPLFASDGSLPVGTVIAGVTASSIQLSAAATSKSAAVTFTAGVQVIQTLEVATLKTLVFGTDYTVDPKHGWLIRLNAWTGAQQPWEALPTAVQYAGGYQSIPSDLAEACLRLVTARYHGRGRDPMLVERTTGQAVGSERYWVGTTPGQRGAFAPEIQGLLDQYRVPVNA